MTCVALIVSATVVLTVVGSITVNNKYLQTCRGYCGFIFKISVYIRIASRRIAPHSFAFTSLCIGPNSYYRLSSELSQLESEKCALGCIFMPIENPSNLPSVVVEAKTQIFFDTNCLVRCYTYSIQILKIFFVSLFSHRFDYILDLNVCVGNTSDFQIGKYG